MADLDMTRNHIAGLLVECDGIPKGAQIVIRNDAPNQTTVLHCDWELKTSPRRARLITLQLTNLATQMFLNADATMLPILDKSLQYIVRHKLNQGYRETDSQNEALLIKVDDCDLR